MVAAKNTNNRLIPMKILTTPMRPISENNQSHTTILTMRLGGPPAMTIFNKSNLAKTARKTKSWSTISSILMNNLVCSNNQTQKKWPRAIVTKVFLILTVRMIRKAIPRPPATPLTANKTKTTKTNTAMTKTIMVGNAKAKLFKEWVLTKRKTILTKWSSHRQILKTKMTIKIKGKIPTKRKIIRGMIMKMI